MMKRKKRKIERYYFDIGNNVNTYEIDEFLKDYINKKDNSIIYRSKVYIEKRYSLIKEYYLIVGIIIVILC